MTTYTKFKEYIWLVNTIYHAKAISLAEINRRWVQTEMSGGVEMARATFNRHKNAIEDIFGIFIECDRQNGYKYYIGNEQVLREDSVQNWMLSTLSVNNIVSESLSLQERILLVPTSSGGEYLPIVIEAMKRNVRVKVDYLRYGADEPKTFDFEPYCIKLFNRRWYVLAHFHRDAASNHVADDYYGIFAFDRITSLEMTDVKFEINPDFDAAEYFQENFGVLVHDGTPLERIVLRIFGQERYYLCDLPLHYSQRVIGSGDDYVDIELMLRPTIDFTRHLMSLGSSVQVLVPYWLADEVQAMHIEAADLYKSMSEEEKEG
ncbi:MAG: WYL domain-containing protein [Prevotella sp.]|nr:WYL domain-containing protein [Prevotella sp.]